MVFNVGGKFIAGVMLGLEVIDHSNGSTSIVVDLLILRLVLNISRLPE